MFTIPPGPFRESDLTHTWEALRAHGERILGHTQLPADRLIATPFGLVIDQTGTSRKWQPSGPSRACHLLDLLELPDYGIHALINQEIGDLAASAFIAICPAYRLAEAAQYLRVEHIGRHLSVYTAPRIHAEIATSALRIPSRAPNDVRLPSAAEIRYGGRLGFDEESAKAAVEHFNLPVLPVAESVVVQLGGQTILAVARSESVEPLRGIICQAYYEPTARRELSRWLKDLSRNLISKTKTATP